AYSGVSGMVMEMPSISMITTHSAAAVAAVRIAKRQMLPMINNLPGGEEFLSVLSGGDGDACTLRESADHHALCRQLFSQLSSIVTGKPDEVRLAGGRTQCLCCPLTFHHHLFRAFQ